MSDEEMLTLTKLAVAHWSIRARKGGVKKYFERVQDDFSKEIRRLFSTARRKILDTIKQWKQYFSIEGSGTGTQSEPGVIGVMRVLVELHSKDVAAAEANEVNAEVAEEAKRARKEQSNMLRRASAKEPEYISDLSSSEGDTDADADKSSTNEVDSQSLIATPTPYRASSRETSSSRGRGRTVAQRKKRKRPEEVLESVVAQMKEERDLRKQELELQKEREQKDREERERLRITQELKDNASLEIIKQIAVMLSNVNSRVSSLN
jgi:hypothetical protein